MTMEAYERECLLRENALDAANDLDRADREERNRIWDAREERDERARIWEAIKAGDMDLLARCFCVRNGAD